MTSRLRRRTSDLIIASHGLARAARRATVTRRLLVIDDAEDKWVLAQFFLELDGRFVVAAAADTDSDLADAQRLRPDGILLDVMMPTSLGVIGKPFDPATLGPPVTSLLVPR